MARAAYLRKLTPSSRSSTGIRSSAEWISRAAKLPAGGAGRYEDALRDLREKYDEEVQKAEKRYLKDGELYEQQRSDAEN